MLVATILPPSAVKLLQQAAATPEVQNHDNPKILRWAEITRVTKRIKAQHPQFFRSEKHEG